MTRLVTTGYETGDVAELGTGVTGTNMTITVVNATPTPRAGAYCLKVACTGTAVATTYKSFSLPAAKTDVWVRWAFFAHPASSSAEWLIGQMLDSAGSAQTSLAWDPTSGLLRVYRGVVTLMATASGAFTADTWHVLEWRQQMTSTTAGTSEVWLDGNRVINFSGDNTNTTNVNVQEIRLGANAGVASATGAYIAFDDIAINDTAGSVNNGRAGDGRVVLLKPNGAGTTTQLTRGGTDTGANYSQVSELPPSMAQYVGSATVDQRDLYTMENLGVAVDSINVVEVIALAQNSDAGAGSIAPTLKSGSTTSVATAIGLATTAAYVRSQWETNPDGSVAWTAAAVDALEAGATIKA
jgi:hypothetical protein